jgi:hypothetical protein
VTIPGLGLALAACGSTFTGNTLAEQVSNWATSTGFSTQVEVLQADLRRIGPAAPGRSPGSLKTDCDVLVTDTLAANQNLPSPDLTLTTLLSDAYTAAGTAGHDCFSGAGGSSPLLARSLTQRTTARRDLIKSLARYDAVTVAVAGGGS